MNARRRAFLLNDNRGSVLREYAVAVVLAAVVVIVTMSLFAGDLYDVYVRVFGP